MYAEVGLRQNNRLNLVDLHDTPVEYALLNHDFQVDISQEVDGAQSVTMESKPSGTYIDIHDIAVKLNVIFSVWT